MSIRKANSKCLLCARGSAKCWQPCTRPCLSARKCRAYYGRRNINKLHTQSQSYVRGTVVQGEERQLGVCRDWRWGKTFPVHEADGWKTPVHCLEQSRSSINWSSFRSYAPSLSREEDVSRQESVKNKGGKEDFPADSTNVWGGTSWLPGEAGRCSLERRHTSIASVTTACGRCGSQWLSEHKEGWGLGSEWGYASRSTW